LSCLRGRIMQFFAKPTFPQSGCLTRPKACQPLGDFSDQDPGKIKGARDPARARQEKRRTSVFSIQTKGPSG
jgi:hypothetical protein